MRIGSLFSGYGGLDLAVMAVLGGRLAWHCENEDAPSKILAHHWPHVPNLGDITQVDWARVQPVDVITAGWPCQPFSLAGKRKGAEDERALWPEVARAVRVVRPRLVVLENVASVVTAGELARAADSLAAVGNDMRWTCLRASVAGAAHRRERFFAVAYPGGEAVGLRAGLRQGWPDPIRRRRPHDNAAPATADPSSERWREGRPEPARVVGRPDAAQCGPIATDSDEPGRQGPQPAQRRVLPTRSAPADADSDGQSRLRRQQPVGRDADRRDRADIAWGIYEPAIRRAEHAFGRPAPEPTEPGRRGGRRLSPRFVEWHMGLPAGWVTDVPGLTRNEQLKALGNGVVPQQAAMALRWLLDTHTTEGTAA